MEPTPEPNTRSDLPPDDILSEFKTALLEETAAIRSNGFADAFQLKNGRFIIRIGNRCHYSFAMERPLSLLWDAPAIIDIPGRPPLNVTLLSARGLTLTASLPDHVGKRIKKARVHYNPTRMLGRWIERLEGFRDRPNPMGQRACGMLAVSEFPASESPAEIVPTKDLDPHQARAVAAALGHDAAFILAPPGTGKTRTIAEIARRLTEKNRSVLVASGSGRSADRIVLEISRRFSAVEGSDGRVIRVGDPVRSDFAEHDHLLPERLAAMQAEAPLKQTARIKEKLRTAETRSIEISRMIDILTWLPQGKKELEEMDLKFLDLQKKKRVLEKRRRALKVISGRIAFWCDAEEEAGRIEAIETKRVRLTERITSLKGEVSDLIVLLEAAVARLVEARSIYAKTSSAGWLARQLRQLPPPEQQKTVVDDLEAETAGLRETIGAKETIRKTLEDQQTHLESLAAQFKRTHPAGRQGIHKKKLILKAGYEPLSRETKRLNKAYHDSRIDMAGLLSARLKILNGWGLTHLSGGPPETVLKAIKTAYAGAQSKTSGLNIDTLRRELMRLEDATASYRKALKKLSGEMDAPEDDPDVNNLEERIIAGAAVVVTTLSTASRHDAVQARQFDTVIIDEAAMTPLPAVWITAGLASARVVVMGDPNQMSPPVLSDGESARKWMGRNVFESASAIWKEKDRSYRVTLRRQYRTHPLISGLTAEMCSQWTPSPPDPEFLLEPGDILANTGRSDVEGIQGDILAPIRMIDTGPCNAWITRVAGRDPADRINFLSAACSVSAAKALLDEDGGLPGEDGNPRVLILTLYDSHAALVDLMIRHEHLENEIHVGTPESLAAVRASAVVLDLVEDDPYSGAPVFRPSADAVILRRMYTCLTRARCRLVVIGDFGCLERRAHACVTGNRIIPALKKRAAILKSPNHILEPVPAAGNNDLGRETTRPETFRKGFIEGLMEDIAVAEKRAVFYSPDLDPNTISILESALLTAVADGVRVYVITRPVEKRRKSEVKKYRSMEGLLETWGVTVIHQMRMHEKLVLIDDRVLWFGSHDPLGADASPVPNCCCPGGMGRCEARAVIAFTILKLGLEKLVEAFDDGTRPRCPICGGEIVAAVGMHRPFYWRCIQKRCYVRPIDHTPRPSQDALRCTRCNGAVEFGTWGGKPCWRCTANRRHRQAIAPTHLTTSETAAKIPARMLARLKKDFRISGPPD